MARGAAAIGLAVRWFSRIGLTLDETDRRLASGFLDALGILPVAGIATVADWVAAEEVLRSPQAGASWWECEERERKRLTTTTAARIGEQMLLEALTSAVEGRAESTYACALRSCGGDEALAKVASGAALTIIHQRALALLAGCAESHAFVQKYELFAAGRFPLGMRDARFIVF